MTSGCSFHVMRVLASGLTGQIPLFVDTQEILDKHKLAVGTTGVNAIGAVNGVRRFTDKYGAAAWPNLQA